MNSSTSSSEPIRPGRAVLEEEDPRWHRFACATLLLIAAICAVLFLVVVPLDPYDTGRLTPLARRGSFAKGPRIANASRIRDEAFDSAIIGNSHIMSLSPERLSQSTALRFVMLAVPGTGVPEQMTVLDAYLARHSTPRAVVIAADSLYCREDTRDLGHHPFPDWLYSPSVAGYLIGLARLSTLEAAGQRIALLLGRRKPQRRDGALDIFDGHAPDAVGDASRVAAAEREDLSNPPQHRRPGLDMLRERLDRISPSTRVVVVLPPVAPQILPEPGTAAAAALQDCKSQIQALVAAYPNAVLVDFHRAVAVIDGPGRFFDATHYYEPVARAVEADIVAVLAPAGVRR